MADTPIDTNLPKSITRPLFVASCVLFGALILLGCWAGMAPLATTIRANGTLASSAPSYDVQHPFGGHIAKVMVQHQSVVEVGQVMFELDVRVQRKNLSIIEAQVHRLRSENAVVRKTLGLAAREPLAIEPDVAVTQRYRDMQRQLDAEIRAAVSSARAAQDRANSIETGIEVLRQRVSALRHRSDQMAALVEKGVLAAAQSEGQTDLMLSVQSQINAQMSELIQLRDQAAQAEVSVQNLRAQHRVTLFNQLKSNADRLPQLERQMVNLQSEIDSAIVHSPINGVVVLLGFDTERMYAPRGTTLLTLSQPLKDPSVTFTIPTQAIDQVRAGMEGSLTIPALPQRNLPKVRIELTSISPDGKRDKDGTVLGYPARAKILAEDMAKVVSAMNGDLHLATDMPVSVSLEGRRITFAQYLFSPFMTMFKGSLQD